MVLNPKTHKHPVIMHKKPNQTKHGIRSAHGPSLVEQGQIPDQSRVEAGTDDI